MEGIDLQKLRASNKVIEMNIALSGLEGKTIQDLANQMILQRHQILEELREQNEGQKIIVEELQEYMDDQNEDKKRQQKQQMEKMKKLNEYFKKQCKNCDHKNQEQKNNELLQEIIQCKVMEIEEQKDDLKFLGKSIIRKKNSSDSGCDSSLDLQYY